MKQLAFLILSILWGSLLNSAFSQDTALDNELGIYEHLDEYISDDLVFKDELYNEINIKDAIDKPTVI